ncbi:MAG: sigma-70 family RNA polymerase sigma factor [Planctomycetota bacterium]
MSKGHDSAGTTSFKRSFTVSDDETFRALLARVVENTIKDRRDWFRARRRTISKECRLPSDTVLDLNRGAGRQQTPSEAAHRNEQEAWVRLAIELIDPKDREIIVLREWDGLEFAAVGERLGMSAEAARKRFGRALSRLGESVCALRRGDSRQALGGTSAARGDHDQE